MNIKTTPSAPPISHPPLFHLIYHFYREWYASCRKLPKLDRYTIGEKVSILLLDILVECTLAYHAKDPLRKRQCLTDMNANFEAIKVLIRLAKDVHAIDQKTYLRYQEKTQTIGKMIGGWIGSIQKTSR